MLRQCGLATGALLCGVALTLSACGGTKSIASKPVPLIVKLALQAVDSAHSTEIAGDIEVSDGRAVRVDMNIFRNGGGYGRLGPPDAEARTVVAGGVVYLRGSARFWKTIGPSLDGSVVPSQASKLAGKWVALPPGSAAALSSLSIEGYADWIKQARDDFAKTGTAVVADLKAVGLADRKGGMLWVAQRGITYPVAIVTVASGHSYRVAFSNWGLATPPTAPAGARPIGQVIG